MKKVFIEYPNIPNECITYNKKTKKYEFKIPKEYINMHKVYVNVGHARDELIKNKK